LPAIEPPATSQECEQNVLPQRGVATLTNEVTTLRQFDGHNLDESLEIRLLANLHGICSDRFEQFLVGSHCATFPIMGLSPRVRGNLLRSWDVMTTRPRRDAS